MVSSDMKIHIDTTEGAKTLIEELRATREAFSDEHIRKIVREQMAAQEEEMLQRFITRIATEMRLVYRNEEAEL